MRSWLAIALMLGVQAAAPRGSLEPGTLPQSWTTGGLCPEQPPFRSHEYNSDFVILRQSGCTNFEKPFLYLIFGERAALRALRWADLLVFKEATDPSCSALSK